MELGLINLQDPGGIRVARPGVPIPFAGSDGAAWPSPWLQSAGGVGALADIQGNRGRQVTSNAAGTFQAMRSTYGATIYTDLRIRGRFAFENPIQDQYIQQGWRMSNGTNGWAGVADFPQDGFATSFRPHLDRVELLLIQGGAFNVHSGINFDFQAGVDVRYEIVAQGDDVTFWVWPVGSARPSTPSYSATIGVNLDSGFVGMACASALANQEVWWSEWSVVAL